MKQLLNLYSDILVNGEESDDRTGTGTFRVFGRQLRFDLDKSFPAVTTKKLAQKAVLSELIWFLEGSNDERRLCEILHGSRDPSLKTIWTGNAQSPYWKPKALFDGEVGRIYGVQWRDFNGTDQITELVSGLKKDPYGRRHIISAWEPSELVQMALPPCHVMSQYFVSNTGKLSCHMYQRSVDTFLGLPFNIASYAILTHMLAQVCGLGVGELIISTGDTHIYKNHIDEVGLQLSRTPLDPPQLWVNPAVKSIFDFTMEDIKLVNYKHHEAITAEMAV
jgi:thymidylate synthase